MRTSILALAALAGATIMPDIAAAQFRDNTGAMPVFALQRSHNWVGNYFGAMAGYGFGLKETVEFRDASDAILGRVGTIQPQGFSGGAVLGRNWQTGQFVYGIEADANIATTRATVKLDAAPGFETTTLRFGHEAYGSLRARAGFAWQQMMLFGTAGVGAVQLTSKGSVERGGETVSLDRETWRASLVGGGGFEFALTNSIVLRTEYLYHFVPEHTLKGVTTGEGLRTRLSPSFHTIRAGIAVPF